jgi:hypothetical protein
MNNSLTRRFTAEEVCCLFCVKKHLNYILKQTSKKNNMMSGTEFSGLASELTMFTSGGGGGGDVSSNTDKTASYNDKSYGDSFSGELDSPLCIREANFSFNSNYII